MKDATEPTRAANQAVAAALPLDDPNDFTLASHGHMAGPPGAVLNEWGFPVWNLEDFAFVDGTAPGTVNPSLWRQGRLNNHGGLFGSPTASTRCAGSTSRTSRSSPATADGSSSIL